jgi:N-methylhydantoinase B
MSMDPISMAIIANRLESIVREMSNTLLRAGRSTVLTIARDFSCAVVTSEHELLASAEGLPVHVCGAPYQAQAMAEAHPDFRDGDAFLHNDPYTGNTHAADHMLLVPVFVDGEHFFTACAKAHQADAGNAVPTTYAPFARDVYEEGALVFPAVQIQRDRRDVRDVIEMCRSRIRVPDQWYGDYLAMVGAARIGERALQELVRKYGPDTIRQFVREWLDYSERRMDEAIRALEPASSSFTVTHDPIPPNLPDGVPVHVQVDVDPAAGRITVDLRDNIDCVPAGVNLSMVCSINHATAGVFNCLDPSIPHNSGSFRRIDVLLRENCVVGIPRFPASCSVSTSNVGDRVVSAVQCALAEAYPDEDKGLAEGAGGLSPGFGVISGTDSRYDDAPFINQIFLGSQGGPGTPTTDGWLVFSNPAASGLLYRDSVEIDELRYPVLVDELRIVPDSGGAGRHRGAPGARGVFGPARDPLSLLYTTDYHFNPAMGVRGGAPGMRGEVFKQDVHGRREPAVLVGALELQPGERVVVEPGGGGGYGPPVERDPHLVLRDVLAGRVSLDAAREVYRVTLVSDESLDGLAIDWEATGRLRGADIPHPVAAKGAVTTS